MITVGQLREALEGLDERMEVLVRWNDDDCCHVGGVLGTPKPDAGCTDVQAFILDADPDSCEAPFTFNGYPVASNDDDACGAASGTPAGFICTLLTGHAGDHVAHTFHETTGQPEDAVARWSNDGAK